VTSLTGLHIASYIVEAQVGAGGMGTVYRALDTKLNRPVAIKFLAGDLADAAARRRFQHEAQAASGLNHPHILTVLDAGESDGRQYLVTEYIEGGTLRDWMASRHEWREVIEILTGVADALATAHEAGILHRDIKPENILITRGGYAKLADFGLAKLRDVPALENAATVADLRTRAGAIVGTAAYMSPEQAIGRTLDQRSDVFSFGIVLYEAVAGRRPFTGPSQPDVLEAILRRPPDQLPDPIPAALRSVITKSLEKNPADRYQSMRDVVVDLRRLLRSSLEPPPASEEHNALTRRPVFVVGVAAVLVLAIVATAAIVLGRRTATEPVRSNVQYTQLTNFADSAIQPALSPDGKMLTFLRAQDPTLFSPGDVYAKVLPDGDAVQVTHDSIPKMSPTFSPDGSRIAYSTGTVSENVPLFQTWVVSVLGGRPQLLLTNAEGLSWISGAAESPRVLFSELTGVGGRMSLVTSTESRANAKTIYVPRSVSGMAHRSYASPDRKFALAVEMEDAWRPCRLMPLDGSSPGKPVGPSPAQCTDAAWSPDGQWMYFSTNPGAGTHIWRQRFPDGAPEQVTFGATEEHGIRFAPDGRSFVTSIGTSQSTVWLHDANGARQLTSEGYAFRPTISADGRRVYYLVRGNSTDTFIAGGLWMVDLPTGQKQRLLPDFEMASYSLSVDGERVAFVDGRAPLGIWIARLDAQTAPRQLFARSAWTVLFSKPGELVFVSPEQDGTLVVNRIGEDGSGLEKMFETTNVMPFAVSRDGRYVIAQDSRRWGALRAFERGTRDGTMICETCSPPQGTDPKPPDAHWAPDGRFLYLKFGDSTYAIPVSPERPLPKIPVEGFRSKDEIAALKGVRLVSDDPNVFAGPNPSIYAFTRVTTQRNIYRVPVPN
jgi:serine/threonine protein kinase